MLLDDAFARPRTITFAQDEFRDLVKRLALYVKEEEMDEAQLDQLADVSDASPPDTHRREAGGREGLASETDFVLALPPPPPASLCPAQQRAFSNSYAKQQQQPS
jgi:hypothetical protein